MDDRQKKILLNIILDSKEDISESSDEDSDVELCTAVVCWVANRYSNIPRVTIKNYVEDVVVNYSDKQFSVHFRIQKQLYLMITSNFNKHAVYKKLHKNSNTRLNISVEKHILVFLWFAGHHTASFRDVADRFDLSLSSLYDVLSRVMFFLNDTASHIIKLPTEEKVKTKNYYAAKGFPNVIGAIDGSHIKIDRPKERPTDYFNRKDYHSVVLQAVCNERLQFLDIFVGYPGSVHDARIFKNSPLFQHMKTFCKDDYILGDSAYPLLPNLLTPYRDTGHLNETQKRYNKIHSSCRVSIEHAFGHLKQRFRQLYHLKLIGPDRICQFITACCVLHNLCQGDGLTFTEEEKLDDNQPGSAPSTDTSKRRAVLIRDNLCKQFFAKN